MHPSFAPLGDTALTVTFGDTIREETNNKVLSLFNLLHYEKLEEVIDVIPAYTTLTIVYDFINIYKQGNRSPYEYMLKKVQKAIHEMGIAKPSAAKVIQIPVCYDVSLSRDLAVISREKDIPIDEIVQLHTSAIYHVYMIGFLPGFSYMGSVDERIAMPRKAVPELNIAAGSVGIAGEQTGIYPLDSPGGWNIVGCTPWKMFDANKRAPCILQAGDKVKFQEITLNRFYEIKRSR